MKINKIVREEEYNRIKKCYCGGELEYKKDLDQPLMFTHEEYDRVYERSVVANVRIGELLKEIKELKEMG
jgi:hypothetical protein